MSLWEERPHTIHVIITLRDLDLIISISVRSVSCHVMCHVPFVFRIHLWLFTSPNCCRLKFQICDTVFKSCLQYLLLLFFKIAVKRKKNTRNKQNETCTSSDYFPRWVYHRSLRQRKHRPWYRYISLGNQLATHLGSIIGTKFLRKKEKKAVIITNSHQRVKKKQL